MSDKAASLQDIRKLKAEYDDNVKRMLSHKEILARILKGVVEEFEDMDVEDIVPLIDDDIKIGITGVEPGTSSSPHIRGLNRENSLMNEGTIYYDILFAVNIPNKDEKNILRLIINIEAQNSFHPGYDIVTRGVYYCAREISSQKNIEFVSDEYQNIKKVYSIWICTNPDKKARNSITRYAIKPDKLYGDFVYEKRSYDLMETVVICIGANGETESDNELIKLLNVYMRAYPTEFKSEYLSKNFGIMLSPQIGEEANRMCDLSDGIEERGIQKGIKEGIQKGRYEGIQLSIEKMVSKGMSLEDALDMLDISKEEYEELRGIAQVNN